MTLEEFKEKYYPNMFWNDTNANVLAIHFAKYHVVEALKVASIEAEVEVELANIYDANSSYSIVDKNSILNAYPLENIK